MKNVNLCKDLADIVAKIQKAKRQDVRDQVCRLQKHLGSTEDLFIDRRSTTWAPGGPARAKVDARPGKKELPQYHVTWRSGGSINCTAADAAAIAKKTTRGLATSIAKSGGKLYLKDNDEDVITITRL